MPRTGHSVNERDSRVAQARYRSPEPSGGADPPVVVSRPSSRPHAMRAGHIARQQRPRGTVGSLRNGLGRNCGAAPRLTDNRPHRSAPISPSQEIGRLIPGSAAARSGCCGVVVWARGPMVASCHSDRVPPTNAPTSRCCGGSLVPRRAADAAARQVWPVVVPGAVPAPRRAEQPHRHLRGKSDPRGHREP